MGTGWKRAVAAAAVLSVSVGSLVAAPVVAQTLPPTPAGTPAAYAAEVVADDPVSWWPLNEVGGTNAADVTGPNAGLVQGGVTVGVPGPFGDASTGFRFDGGRCSGVDVGRQPSTLATPRVTVEAWTRTDTTARGIIFRWRNYGYGFHSSNDGLSIDGWPGGSGSGASGGTGLTDGAWHHVVGSYTGSAWELYIDGELVATQPASGDIYYAGANAVAIGRDANACDGVVPSFRGDLAHVAVYDEPLTADRVRAHFCAGRPDAEGCTEPAAVDAGPEQTVVEGEVVSLHGSVNLDPVAVTSVPLTVSSQANIFGAGHDVPPAPGGGGGGELPVNSGLRFDGPAEVTVSDVAGSMTAYPGCGGAQAGPDGSTYRSTNISSYGGISGISDSTMLMLVGVFLTDDEPTDPAPPRLGFSGNHDFTVLRPQIGQTFFIGDGLTGSGVTQRFVVPEGATRLFLGVADAGGFQGAPGYYNDNCGFYAATVHAEISRPATYRWEVVAADGPPVQLSSTTTLNPSFVALDDGTYRFRLTATNGTQTASDETTVVVDNADPVVDTAADPAAVDGLAMVTASFTDPGALDIHGATYDWGDGSPPEVVPASVQGTGWGYVHAGHRYAELGEYTVTVTANDDDGGTSAIATTVIDVGGAGSDAVPDAAAVWADARTGTGVLSITGSGTRIDGLVHSNSDIALAGTNQQLVGGTEYVTALSLIEGPHVIDPPAQQVTAADPPRSFPVADYRPGGRVAVAAGDDFHEIPASECSGTSPVWKPRRALAEGVYYTTCAVQLAGPSAGGHVTIVSERSIQISGSGTSWDPYVDGLLFLAAGTDTRAVDIAGHGHILHGAINAPNGGLEVTGASNRFDCGLQAQTVRISGGSNAVQGGECGLVTQPVPTITVAAPPIVVPHLASELDGPASPVVPGSDLAYTAELTNDAALLVVPGLVGLENRSGTPTTITGITARVEALDPATELWTPVGTTTVQSRPNPVDGVTYGETTDGITGTTVAPGAFATWSAALQLSLDPATVGQLLDPTRTTGLRTIFEVQLDPTVRHRRVARFDDDLLTTVRSLGASLSELEATVVVPAAGPSLLDSTNTPAFASLAPGVTAAAAVPTLAPTAPIKGDDEPDDAYLARLSALDNTIVVGSSFATAVSSIGPIVAPQAIHLGTVQVPVLTLDAAAPSATNAGENATWTFTVTNTGSVTATGIDLAPVLLSHGIVTATGIPDTLAPGATATGIATWAVPEGTSTSLTVRATLTWGQDGAPDTAYGPITDEASTVARPPLAVRFTKFSSTGTATPAGQLEYHLEARNIGATPLTGVVLEDILDPSVELVDGSVAAPRGTLTTTPGSVRLEIGDLPPGDYVSLDFNIDFSGAPATQATTTNQATLTSDQLPAVPSDDPSAPGAEDPTITPIAGNGGGGGGGGGTGTPGPTVDGLSPADGSTITAPTAVTATLAPRDGTTVTGWTTSLVPRSGGAPVPLGNGTDLDVVESIDPTVLANGIWTLRLVATDDDGGTTRSETTVVIDGQLKLGRYRTTYLDLDVPVAGIPIQVLRTYDTLDRNDPGDFGYGWNLELANFRIASNRRLGDGTWTIKRECIEYPQFGQMYWLPCYETTNPRYVTVTWPDGRTETFDFKTQTTNFFPNIGQGSYQGRPGTTSTLAPAPGDDTFAQFNGTLYTDFFNPTQVYNPTRWELTAADGTTYLLDAATGLVEAADRNGNTVTVTPDGVTSSFGPGIDFHRGPDGRIDSITAPGGATVEYEQDTNGDLVEVTDARDFVTAFTYEPDSSHYLSDIDDPGTGFLRRLDYENGRLTTITDATGAIVTVDVDPNARTEVVTSNGGRLQTVSAYDEAGQLVAVDRIHDGQTRRTSFGYTAAGQLESRTDPGAGRWRAGYLPTGELGTVEEPDGHTITLTYRDDHQLETWRDGEGRTSTYVYGADDVLDRINLPDGTAFAYTWTPRGQLESVTPPGEGTTSWSYNAVGQLETETSPAGLTRWTYDDAGRPETETGPSGAWAWTYYDNGLVHTESGPDGLTEWTYDHAGRIDTVTVNGQLTDYGYDELGNLEHEQYPDGTVVDRVWDGRQLMSEATPTGTMTWTYDGAGRQLTETGPEGELSWTWSQDDRVESLERRDGTTAEFDWHADGRIAEIRDSAAGTSTYTWDGAGRLFSVSGGRSTRTFEWDVVGNFIGRTVTEIAATPVSPLVTAKFTNPTTDPIVIPERPPTITPTLPRSPVLPSRTSPIMPTRSRSVGGLVLGEYSMLVEWAISNAPVISAVGVAAAGRIDELVRSVTVDDAPSHKPVILERPEERPDERRTPVEPRTDEENCTASPSGAGDYQYGPMFDYPVGSDNPEGQASHGAHARLYQPTGHPSDPQVDPLGYRPGSDPQVHAGHLIAARFGGSNDDPGNFASLFARPNQSGMGRAEAAVARALRRPCVVVDVDVTLYYSPPPQPSLGDLWLQQRLPVVELEYEAWTQDGDRVITALIENAP